MPYARNLYLNAQPQLQDLRTLAQLCLPSPSLSSITMTLQSPRPTIPCHSYPAISPQSPATHAYIPFSLERYDSQQQNGGGKLPTEATFQNSASAAPDTRRHGR